MPKAAKEKCPDCHGAKLVQGYYTVGLVDCVTCGGTGVKPEEPKDESAASE